MNYLDTRKILDARQTKTPVNRSRTGYGPKLPTSWQVQLRDKRWRRVYVVCYSNSGTAYIHVGKEKFYFYSSWQPEDFKKAE